jgi:hypothetical protein
VTEVKNAELLQQAPQRFLSSTFRLLVIYETRQMKVLMVSYGGEQALPVFSGGGKAEMSVWLGVTFVDGWWVKETSIGELVSMLYGSCARVKSVALDPPPEIVGADAVSHVSMTRKRFLSWVADSPCSFSPKASARRHARESMRPL